MMKWIEIDPSIHSTKQIPLNETVIVEDENGWIGQAYWNDYDWVLETFGQVYRDINFGQIVRYFILKDQLIPPPVIG